MTATAPAKTTKNRAAINRAVLSIIQAMPAGLTFSFHEVRRRAQIVVEQDIQVNDASLHENLQSMIEAPDPLLIRVKKGTYQRVEQAPPPPPPIPQVQHQAPLLPVNGDKTPWEILAGLEARMGALEGLMQGLLAEWKGGSK